MERKIVFEEKDPIAEAFDFIGAKREDDEKLDCDESRHFIREHFNERLKSVETFEELMRFVGYMRYFALRLRGKRSNHTASNFKPTKTQPWEPEELNTVEYLYGFGERTGKSRISNLYRVLKVE